MLPLAGPRGEIVGSVKAAWLRPAALATPLYLLSCGVSEGGLLSRRPWGDVGQYERYSRLVLGGEIPYHDFYLEYPPGALIAFLPPAVITDSQYLSVFKLFMALVGLAALFATAWLLARLGASRGRLAVALAAISLAPLALGHTFLNRFDPLPALLAVLALAALVARMHVTAGGLLALGFAVKLFAAVAAPVAAVRIQRTAGRRGVVEALVSAAAVGVLVFGFFLVVAFGGLGNTYYTQGKRGLQIESIGASLLLAADRIGLGEARSATDSPGSIDLGGAAPAVVAQLTSILQILAVLAVALLYLRRPEGDERLVAAFAAAVTAFTIFGKVLSPQFLTWLVFLVPLVGGAWRLHSTGLLIGALGLTQLEQHGYVGLEIDDWAVWVLLLRNALLVLLFVLLVATVRATSIHVPNPRAGGGHG